ncbi:MAG: hypothetical protein MK207_16245, partial [Saprospiraceae bacterium]|nr:hypothetical protein [Saprospiraceae bacterium]
MKIAIIPRSSWGFCIAPQPEGFVDELQKANNNPNNIMSSEMTNRINLFSSVFSLKKVKSDELYDKNTIAKHTLIIIEINNSKSMALFAFSNELTTFSLGKLLE